MNHIKDRTNEENVNYQGLKMWIKEYRKCDDIDVIFEDDTIVENRSYYDFKNGFIRNINYNINYYIGTENINNQGLKMKVIKYNNYSDIDVQFEDGLIIKNRNYNDFKKGSIKNLFYPQVYGVGFIGEGKYRASIKGKHTKCYLMWKSMLERCYSEKLKQRNPTYKNCKVDKYFHNFQNFAEWFDKNYYEIEGETMCLDKDILCHNLNLKNKIYSPYTCLFVPKSINSTILKCDKSRGNYSVGVHFEKERNKYVAVCSINRRAKFLGRFDTPEEAFECYKEAKENEIKRIADLYKYKIPEKLYNELYSYKVEIDD